MISAILPDISIFVSNCFCKVKKKFVTALYTLLCSKNI